MKKYQTGIPAMSRRSYSLSIFLAEDSDKSLFFTSVPIYDKLTKTESHRREGSS